MALPGRKLLGRKLLTVVCKLQFVWDCFDIYACRCIKAYFVDCFIISNYIGKGSVLFLLAFMLILKNSY
ncbi:hypothetical protein SLEP1_g28274 [Rubroshorea leprosula]|uniref:Uncharacterized protein n=1 Tax=Rubroshorea leprosula TaxID=152421 RepID=A0AAV5JT45_9ROSI|nr:hypothetical protein SLEP1_g28274 [Rubroshorea leprosula]